MSAVKIIIEGQREAEAKLNPSRVKRIRWSAINEAGRSGRTFISRDVREVLAAPAKEVNEAISLKRIGESGDGGFAEINVRRKAIALKAFSPRQTKAGVTVLVRRDQGRRLVKGAFGPRIDKLHGRVYKRQGADPKPLREFFGQTAASIAANSPNLLQRVSKRIADQLKARYLSKLGYELGKSA